MGGVKLDLTGVEMQGDTRHHRHLRRDGRRRDLRAARVGRRRARSPLSWERAWTSAARRRAPASKKLIVQGLRVHGRRRDQGLTGRPRHSHPIVARPRAVAAVPAGMARVRRAARRLSSRFAGTRPSSWAAVYAMPLAILLGIQSLSSWYLVQVLPADGTPLAAPHRHLGRSRLRDARHLGSRGTRLGLAAACHPAAGARRRSRQRPDAAASVFRRSGFAGRGARPLHARCVRDARRRRSDARWSCACSRANRSCARCAAQLDPHFLFNSLNSIAALIGSDAPARGACAC